MMKYLKIKNYERYQHFKNRGRAAWIRLYTKMFDDHDISQWTDSQQLAWLKIILYASEELVPDVCGKCAQCSGITPSFTAQYLPNDSSFLRQKLGLSNRFNLDFYIKQGFLVEIDNKLITKCYPRTAEQQNSRTAEQQRGESEPPEPTPPPPSEKPEKKKTEPRLQGVTLQQLNLAKRMRDDMLKIHPGLDKVIRTEGWAGIVRDIMQVKKRTDIQILDAWEFARGHTRHWAKRIRGPSDLMAGDNLEMLELDMIQESRKPEPAPNRYEKARNQSAGFAERYKNGELRIGHNQLSGFGGEIPQSTGKGGNDTS